MVRVLERVYIVLPSGRVTQGALFGRAMRMKEEVCKVHIQGSKKSKWMSSSKVFASATDALSSLNK